MNTVGPLVDSAWLAAHVGDPRLRVIDFRWQQGQPGRAGHEAGHIPGAVFVDLEAGGLSGHQAGGGRHPLPERHAFEAAMRDARVNRDSTVIVYDDQNGFRAREEITRAIMPRRPPLRAFDGAGSTRARECSVPH